MGVQADLIKSMETGSGGGGAGGCGDCSVCININCQPRTPGNQGTPCFCEGSCGFCETCDASGSCVPMDPARCGSRCNCKVSCPGSTTVVETSYFQQYKPNVSGPATPCWFECQQEAQSRIEDLCPPAQPDPCTTNGGNDCLTNCQCVTNRTNCGESEPPCPDGYKCESQGNMFASPNGYCDDSLGGITWFRKQCIQNEPGTPGADGTPCGTCTTKADCGDCKDCVGGKCERAKVDGRDACSRECPGPECDGDCCQADEVCERGCSYEIIENCHFSPFVVTGSCEGISLRHTTNISKEDAVCFRFHTHCDIVDRNGEVIGTHLDCQASYRRLGGEGARYCAKA